MGRFKVYSGDRTEREEEKITPAFCLRCLVMLIEMGNPGGGMVGGERNQGASLAAFLLGMEVKPHMGSCM